MKITPFVALLLLVATISVEPCDSKSKEKVASSVPLCNASAFSKLKEKFNTEKQIRSKNVKKTYGLLVPALATAGCCIKYNGGGVCTNLLYRFIGVNIKCDTCNYQQSFVHIPLVAKGSPECWRFPECQNMRKIEPSDFLKQEMLFRNRTDAHGIYVECATCKTVEFIEDVKTREAQQKIQKEEQEVEFTV